MIAGTLLPAWLLGHLFLSFYPAPESATDPTNTVASESMGDSDAGEGKIPGAEGEAGKSGSALADTNSSKTVTHTFAPQGSKSADIESKIAELELENRTLKSEMMSSQADSNVVGQLRGQLTMTSQELTTTKENLTNTESRLRTTEAEMQTLRSNLSETQSRLQLAQTNLENAKQMATPAAGEALPMMELGPLAAHVDTFSAFAVRLFVGLVIFALGMFLSTMAANQITGSGMENSKMLATIARCAILVFAGGFALQHIGVSSTIVNTAFMSLLGGLGVAVAIAFGWGGRDAAKRILDRHVK